MEMEKVEKYINNIQVRLFKKMTNAGIDNDTCNLVWNFIPECYGEQIREEDKQKIYDLLEPIITNSNWNGDNWEAVNESQYERAVENIYDDFIWCDEWLTIEEYFKKHIPEEYDVA